MQVVNRLKSAAAHGKKLAKQRGQGMTEYIIILALIAVAAIAATQLFGNVIRNQTAAIANEVAGNDGTAARAAAGSNATTAASDAVVKRNLENFTGNVSK